MSQKEELYCEVCGKPLSKCKPFMAIDFASPKDNPNIGSLLIKNYRCMAEELTQEQLKEYRKKYGNKDADFYEQLANSVESSIECQDCFHLSDGERLKKRDETMKEAEMNVREKVMFT